MPLLTPLFLSAMIGHAQPRFNACDFALRAPVTAAAEPEDLMRVFIALFPASHPIFAVLSEKFREGWLRAGVYEFDVETILQHTLNLVRAVRDFAAVDGTYDVARAMWMALIHDFAEWVVPDYTPHDGIELKQKFAEENAAWDDIVERLGPEAAFFKDLWLEFEAGVTPEARVVAQLDPLDAFVRACAYERQGYAVGTFFRSIGPRVSDPWLTDVIDELMAKRHDPAVDPRALYHRRLRGLVH